jgi:protein ImuB
VAPVASTAPSHEAGAGVLPTVALRLLEAPEPVEVECVGAAPSVVWWRGRRMPVSRAVGPERLSGDWWQDAYRRDYWRCEAGESEFVVYVDRGRGAVDAASWYLHGWYD